MEFGQYAVLMDQPMRRVFARREREERGEVWSQRDGAGIRWGAARGVDGFGVRDIGHDRFLSRMICQVSLPNGQVGIASAAWLRCPIVAVRRPDARRTSKP
jgi:hypothetical protein